MYTTQEQDNLKSKVIAKIEQDIKNDDYFDLFYLLSFLPTESMTNYLNEKTIPNETQN